VAGHSKTGIARGVGIAANDQISFAAELIEVAMCTDSVRIITAQQRAAPALEAGTGVKF
jgi:hypothetical protein